MQQHGLLKLGLLFALAQVGLAQSPIVCGNGVKCPQEAPCCSWYNQCGTGASCLGGCNPLFSTTLESCKPQPICQERSSSFRGRNEILASDFYFGDATQAEWVSNGPLIELDGEAKLTLEKDNPGTTLFSTSYIWYGKVSAIIQSSSSIGVGVQFALLSDVQEGLGFQFVGSKPHRAEAGYFLRANNINSYKNSSYDGMTDVALNQHNYTVDWAPDFTAWYIDGHLVSTLDRASTYNSTLNKYMYPQTPARVQLTIWPAGDPANGQDSVEWAGGEISYNDTQYNSTGYYDAGIFGVDIDCYSPPSGSQVNGTNAYIYTSTSMTNTSIEVTNDNTTIPNPSITGSSYASSTSAAPTATASSNSTSAGSAGGVTEERASGLSTGAKAGIAIGVVLGIGAIAIVGFLLYRRSRKQQASTINDPAPAYNATDYQRPPVQQVYQQPQAELGGALDYRYGFADVEPKSELASSNKDIVPVVSELAHSSTGTHTPVNEHFSTLEAVELSHNSPVTSQSPNAHSATTSGEPNISEANTVPSSGSPRPSKDLSR